MTTHPRHAATHAAIEAELAEMAEQGRLRSRSAIDGPAGRVVRIERGGRRATLLNWASNDYLGCAQRLVNRNAATRAIRQHGAGSGAARLLAGGVRIHRRLELRLAGWLQRPECLLATTGFQINLAAITSLVTGRQDALVLDRLCHASLIDGARLSGAALHRFGHNDVDDLERRLAALGDARRVVVVVESVYSMDGDEAPLAAIAACCQRHGALLLVDEAHALGVYGPQGRGLCAEHGVVPDLITGTASKSLGAQGGFALGSSAVIELMVNRGRSFIYSTAPVPAASGAAVAALDYLRDQPDLGLALQARAGRVRAALQAQGWQVPDGRGPIIPVLVGSEAATLALAEQLRQAGHYTPAIRPPTVPEGGCRLRLTVTLGHREVDCRRLVQAMQAARASQAQSPA